MSGSTTTTVIQTLKFSKKARIQSTKRGPVDRKELEDKELDGYSAVVSVNGSVKWKCSGTGGEPPVLTLERWQEGKSHGPAEKIILGTYLGTYPGA